MEQKKLDNKGFSLVELIIVIAIMAILVGVLAPQYIKYVNKSRVSTDIQTITSMGNALQTLAIDPSVTVPGGTQLTLSSTGIVLSVGSSSASDVVTQADLEAILGTFSSVKPKSTEVSGAYVKWTGTELEYYNYNNGKTTPENIAVESTSGTGATTESK